jgi:hypothetical protein
MKNIFFTLFMACCPAFVCAQQGRIVENKPYIDLRPFHFGVVVGTHFQDIEFRNAGPQIIVNEDGTTTEKLITTDQDQIDMGFTVGVLGEMRLGTHFALRAAPAMLFGNKHLTFLNHNDKLEDGKPIEMHQNLKSIYISAPVNLIFSAKRFNNHRPYLLAGLNPMINLSRRQNDILRLKSHDLLLEVGAGCDFYLPFFKLRPELKFGFGLIDNLDKDHINHIKDKSLYPYVNSVNQSKSKFVSLSFYFE